MSGIILDADQIHEGISHGFIRLPHEDQVCYVVIIGSDTNLG